MAEGVSQKPIHSLILDTGPLIKNAVSISTIVNSAEDIYTTSAIMSEIRDEATRSRVQTSLVPFLKIKNPSQSSYDAVIAFSKKTGDYASLSRQDLGILALAYEVHCERNGGAWGLREAPRQPLKMKPGEKEVKKEPTEDSRTEEKIEVDEGLKVDECDIHIENAPNKEGAAVAATVQVKNATVGEENTANAGDVQVNDAVTQEQDDAEQKSQEDDTEGWSQVPVRSKKINANTKSKGKKFKKQNSTAEDKKMKLAKEQEKQAKALATSPSEQTKAEQSEDLHATSEPEAMNTEPPVVEAQKAEEITHVEASPEQSQPATATDALPHNLSNLNMTTPPSPPATEDEDSDGGDWINSSNLDAHMAADAGLPTDSGTSSGEPIDVATMTIDFAMQNVLLQMNLQLLSTNMQRIRKLTSKVLRCHACFLTVKDTSRQFCPRCGGATLKRVNCSTNSRGEFRLHLAKNYQFNKRGDKYAIPKPIAGTANGKWSGQGGGQGGWGRDLILAEDQKEFTRQMEAEKRSKGAARDVMDDDYLPGILTGDRARGRAGGRPKVGAGKNVNSKRKH
ncbi:20S-pre-rRNA D-site endonuclease nob1 [Pleosporales sp. CAS-2024a]